MSWRPPLHERPELDPRVEACRDHAAELSHDDGRKAVLYCRVDTAWTQLGASLWWRRWSPPHYRLEGYWLGDDQWDDFLCDGEQLEELLDDFDRGVFVWLGEPWRFRWLDDEGSRVVREKHGFEIYPH